MDQYLLYVHKRKVSLYHVWGPSLSFHVRQVSFSFLSKKTQSLISVSKQSVSLPMYEDPVTLLGVSLSFPCMRAQSPLSIYKVQYWSLVFRSLGCLALKCHVLPHFTLWFFLCFKSLLSKWVTAAAFSPLPEAQLRDQREKLPVLWPHLHYFFPSLCPLL